MKFCWNGTASRKAKRTWTPGQDDAQLLQQLAEVAVEALALGLVPS